MTVLLLAFSSGLTPTSVSVIIRPFPLTPSATWASYTVRRTLSTPLPVGLFLPDEHVRRLLRLEDAWKAICSCPTGRALRGCCGDFLLGVRGGGVGGIAWPIEVLARLNDEGVHSRDRVLKSARTVDRPARRTGVAGPTASPAGLVSAGRQRGAGPGQPAVAQGPTFGLGKPELGPSVAPKPGRVGGKLNRPIESHSPSDGGPRHTAAKAAPSYEFPLC